MRRSGNTFLALFFLLGLACLVGMGPAAGYGAQPSSTATDEVVCDDKFCLTRSKTGEPRHLVYRFRGLTNQWQEVSCDIRESDSKKLSDSFGYMSSERTASWSENLEKTINVATRLSLSPEYGEARVTKDTIDWVAAKELPPLAGEEIIASERKNFIHWYEIHKAEIRDLANKRFLSAHGITTIPDLGEIPDYSSIVSKSSPALKSCIDAFDRTTGGNPEILQKFFQAMFYEKIPMQEGDRWTHGLRLPSTVMLQGKGDCDSKAAAFCTIQRKRNERRLVILRSLPGKSSLRHALVGVEAWTKDGPHPKEAWPYKRLPEALKAILYGKPIRIGLRDYWPCEVAGRERTDYGKVGDGHAGRYVAILIQ